MRITDISVQSKNKDRVNVSVDGRYRFSLDIFQVGELGIKIGNDYSESELTEIETESKFGKLYMRALEYTLMRPHSGKEIRDYLQRKTRTTKKRNPKSGEVSTHEGVSQTIVDRVYSRLDQKGYIDDEKFARFWVDNRNQRKGTSRRKLEAELRSKGVNSHIIDIALENSVRTDSEELKKIIDKKRSKYSDDKKFMQFLARQGFRYEDIKNALSDC